MLKMVSGVVLVSLEVSTYGSFVRLDLALAAAFLNILQVCCADMRPA